MLKLLTWKQWPICMKLNSHLFIVDAMVCKHDVSLASSLGVHSPSFWKCWQVTGLSWVFLQDCHLLKGVPAHRVLPCPTVAYTHVLDHVEAEGPALLPQFGRILQGLLDSRDLRGLQEGHCCDAISVQLLLCCTLPSVPSPELQSRQPRAQKPPLQGLCSVEIQPVPLRNPWEEHRWESRHINRAKQG